MSQMTKTQIALLKAFLPVTFKNADALIEIIDKTEAPDICLALLTGTYEEPTFPQFSRPGYGDKPKVGTFVSFDKFTGTVKYSYEDFKRKGAYFQKVQDMSIVTLENYQKFEVKSSSPESQYKSFLTGELETQYSHSDQNNWIEKGCESPEIEAEKDRLKAVANEDDNVIVDEF